jgi:tetratricopeptide (TPR) repeat protein
MPTLAQTLDEARRRQRAGDYGVAEQLCRQILQTDAECADGWFHLGEAQQGQGRATDAVAAWERAVRLQPRQPRWLLRLGTVLAEAGQREQAVKVLRRAVDIQPNLADAHYQLGVVLAQLGQTEPATASYHEAVRCQPEHVEALTNLGVLLARQGRHDAAITTLRRAIAVRPTFAKAHHNLGVALAEQGQLTEAAASLKLALQHKPDYAEAHFNLANTLRELGRRDEALTSFYEALHYRPDYPEALNNLGLLLTEVSRPAEALILLRQALRLRPEFAEARNNLGLALAELGRFDEAIACYEDVLRQNPRAADTHTNLGSAYKEQGRLEEAVACYDVALRLKPEAASTHWNRALAWLQQGDYARGWAEYEWRWRRPQARPRSFRQPLWDGTPLAGRTVLLWCEQGLGDAIQFVRYAPLVQERGGRVLLECPPPLRRLFEGLTGVERLLVEGADLPPFDVHAPLMSLPYLCHTTRATIPASVPYLYADRARIERWRPRLPVGKFRIGVVWQGNPQHKWDRHRSFPLHALAPLAAVPGVQLLSLQKGHGLDVLQTEPPRFPLMLLGDDLDADAPFVDTTALMTQLDLVVTADTAAAHLAGALGVPVWVALGVIADWRWLRGRDDTRWYPTMRLFRQRTLGDWDEIFARMAQGIARLVQQREAQALQAPITPGELIDKLTILAIKRERIADPEKRAHVEGEWTALAAVRERVMANLPEVEELAAALRSVNETLWQAEDDIRLCEQAGDFGPRFIALARSIYRRNDERSRLKRRINELLGAPFGEQKQYAAAAEGPDDSDAGS